MFSGGFSLDWMSYYIVFYDKSCVWGVLYSEKDLASLLVGSLSTNLAAQEDSIHFIDDEESLQHHCEH